MTQEQQRIAIAEACGLKLHTERVEHTDGYQWVEVRQFWICPKGRRVAVPDYLNDLNAMHEAEKTLLKNDALLWHKYASHLDENYINQPYTVGATATQRAEAFLRTLNLWKE